MFEICVHSGELPAWFAGMPFQLEMLEESLCCGDFSRSSHASDLKIGTPVATLPRAWCYRVSAGTS